jgi:type II secretory pathway pseudopilin PulG
MNTVIRPCTLRELRSLGFTLMETVIAMAVGALMLGGLILGYVLSTQRAEWSAYSLAAQSLANQRIEQARAIKWDPLAFPPRPDLLVNGNFPPQREILDIPVTGGQITYATNYTTITDIPGPSPVKMIRVDCVWQFCGRGVYTNSIATYRAPDQ